MKIPRVNFLGCPMDLVAKSDFLAHIESYIDTRAETKVIQFVNANKVSKVAEDASMKELMWKADYVLTDGQPLVLMAKALGITVPDRIDGIGLMHSLLELANRRNYKVYLLGAKQEIVEKCVEIIGRDLPGVKIVGYRNGYFKMSQAEEIANGVAATNPDLLFLGMGSPMKEELAEIYRDKLGSKVIQGVGGSFDVMAGLVPRAPVWMQRLCLEWLFRVIQEPRRMFWRYMTTNFRCLWIFFKALARRVTGNGTKTVEATNHSL